MQNIALWAARATGMASFFTPCHLPLLPAYITFLAGDGERRGHFFLTNALAFCLGFGTVFVVLGASFGFIGSLLARYHDLFRWGGGLVMIIFGLHMTGWLQISFLYREQRWQTTPRSGPVGAFLLGFSFAFAWTPCVGPVLGSILTLASLSESTWTGTLMLISYTVGMSVPFLIVAGIVYQGSTTLLQRFYPLAATLSKVGGLVLVAMGLLTMFNRFPISSGSLGF
jgi:cytochrome c-type biogenesis protein